LLAEIGPIAGTPASQGSQYRQLSCPDGFALALLKWRFSASHSSGARLVNAPLGGAWAYCDAL
jgi:hypothetical protein